MSTCRFSLLLMRRRDQSKDIKPRIHLKSNNQRTYTISFFQCLFLSIPYATKGDQTVCLVCDESYCDYSTFLRHVRKVHNGVRYQCPICIKKKTFTEKWSFKKHVNAEHPEADINHIMDNLIVIRAPTKSNVVAQHPIVNEDPAS